MKRGITRLAASSLVALAISATANAQEAPLEEITVTAQKREQNLQDVAISISAFSGTELLDRGIDGIIEIQEMVPNLRASRSGFGSSAPRFALRGVGSQTDRSTVSSSPVAVHVNEVAAAYPITTTNLMFDLERVEVLRGPQGDLFGLNTTGGTINFITNKPTDEFDSSVLVELANHQRYKVEGFISGPLTDSIRARLAVSRNQRNEGPQTNVNNGEDYGQFERMGSRLSLNFTPSDALNIDLELHATTTDEEPTGARNIDIWPYIGATGNPAPQVIQDPWGVAFNSNPDSRPGQGNPNIDHEGLGGRATIGLDFGSLSLTSITAYEDFKRREYIDADGAIAQDGYRVYWSDLWSFSQEFRLGSFDNSEFQWMVGANYGKDHLNQTTIFDQPDNVDFPAVGGQNPIQDREIYAVFTHVEYTLRDNLVLIGGLRYTDETRTESNIGTFLYADVLGIFGGFFGESPDLANFVPGEILTGNCIITGFVEPCDIPSSPIDDQITDSDWSGKLGLNYFVNDESMLYATLSRGTKSGGFNDIAAASFDNYIPTTPEYLNSLELGVKTTLADGRIRVNAAAFYYDYEDQQVGGINLSPAYGPLNTVVNAPESEIKGAELELSWRLNDNWSIRQNIGYTGAKFKKYAALNGAGIRAYRDDCTAFTGSLCEWAMPDPNAPWFNPLTHVGTNDLAGSSFGGPRWSISGAVDFNVPIGTDYELGFNFDYNYTNETNTDEKALAEGSFRRLNSPDTLPSDIPFFMADTDGDGIEEKLIRGGYDRLFVNGRITLSRADTWDLSLFGRNLTDERIYGTGGGFNNNIALVPNPGRNWGLRLRYNF